MQETQCPGRGSPIRFINERGDRPTAGQPGRRMGLNVYVISCLISHIAHAIHSLISIDLCGNVGEQKIRPLQNLSQVLSAIPHVSGLAISTGIPGRHTYNVEL